MNRVDLNCDVGEETRAGTEVTSTEARLLEVVSSVNIACGFHAGDYRSMAALVAAAAAAGVAIGAHPGLPDRQGFGRKAMQLTSADVYHLVLYQLGALSTIAAAAGSRVSQIKPHGELYHMAQRDLNIADAIVRATKAVEPSCMVFGFSGGTLVRAAENAGVPAAREVFADRNYTPDGTLVSRDHPRALINDTDVAIQRVLDILQLGKIVAIDGSIIEDVHVDTICVHSDTPGAVQLAVYLASAVKAQGYRVAALGVP